MDSKKEYDETIEQGPEVSDAAVILWIIMAVFILSCVIWSCK